MELNRPETLNSLSLSMINTMTDHLKLWAETSTCSAVIIKAIERRDGKAIFCSGGDVVGLLKNRHQTDLIKEFFEREYTLNHLIGTYPKPIISFIDGITSITFDSLY